MHKMDSLDIEQRINFIAVLLAEASHHCVVTQSIIDEYENKIKNFFNF